MTFQDIFKKTFLEGWQSTEIGASAMLSTMLVVSVLSVYIFFVYRVVTRKTFYSKNFNISLACVAVTTAAIIITIQSSIVVSLGMVGALSIVRFRTAIKDPMDLAFLFWSISTGIICGAGLAEFAVILALVLTVGILVLNHIPVAKAPTILVVSASDLKLEAKVLSIAEKYCRGIQVKARNMTASTLDLTVEVRTAEGSDLLLELMELEGILSASLLSHDGEVTF